MTIPSEFPVSSLPGFRPRIVVKFWDWVVDDLLNSQDLGGAESDFQVLFERTIDSDAAKELERDHPLAYLLPWPHVRRQLPSFEFGTAYSDRPLEHIVKAVNDVASPATALSIFRIDLPDVRYDSERDQLTIISRTRAQLTDAVALLRESRTVERAYLASPAIPPPSWSMVDLDQLSDLQTYLWGDDETGFQQGVNAVYGWNRLGDGRGIRWVDIEQGWTLQHVDLPQALASDAWRLVTGANISNLPLSTCFSTTCHETDHGTAMLGLVVARDNEQGLVGIAPNAETFLASELVSENVRNLPLALEALAFAVATGQEFAAGHTLRWGDVVLIESQVEHDGHYLPVEFEWANYFWIDVLTNQGVIVVEAAGNGSTDLDTVVDDAGEHVLSRTAAVRDSFAVIVGAGERSADQYIPRPSSNYGSRVDCFAHGGLVWSLTDSGGQPWTQQTGGTSTAAAIIAGVVLILQSLAATRHSQLLDPFWLREHMLRAPGIGATTNPPVMGMLPNIELLVNRFQNLL